MSRFNTGNPLGSGSPLDLDDNAKNMDLAVNSEEPQWIDRFGRPRLPLMEQERQFVSDQERRDGEFQADQADRESEFRTFIASSGYQFAGDYAAGIEITQYNQLVRDENGEFWRVSGQVDLPYVTTGAGIPEDDALVPAGDAALRQQLASELDSGGGAFNVAGSAMYVGSLPEMEALPKDRLSDGQVVSVPRRGEYSFHAPSQTFHAVQRGIERGSWAVIDGIQSWWARPSCVKHGDKVFAAFSSSAGQLAVSEFDQVTQGLNVTTLTETGEFNADDHNTGSICVSDDAIALFYPGRQHNRAAKNKIYYFVGSGPSLSGLVRHQISTAGTQTDYPNAYRGNDGFVLFYRTGDTFDQWRVRTNSWPLGDWSQERVLLNDSAARPYITSRQNTGDPSRIDFAIGFHPDQAYRNVHVGYIRRSDGDWRVYNFDGTEVANISTGVGLPLSKEQFDIAYSEPAGRQTRLVDVVEGAVAVVDFVPGNGNYVYCRFNGSAWVKSVIAPTGLAFMTPSYFGGVTIDDDDPLKVYVARELLGTWHLESYVSSDAGTSWQRLELMEQSGTDVIGRPIAVVRSPGLVGPVDSDPVFFMGKYGSSSYTDFMTALGTPSRNTLRPQVHTPAALGIDPVITYLAADTLRLHGRRLRVSPLLSSGQEAVILIGPVGGESGGHGCDLDIFQKPPSFTSSSRMVFSLRVRSMGSSGAQAAMLVDAAILRGPQQQAIARGLACTFSGERYTAVLLEGLTGNSISASTTGGIFASGSYACANGIFRDSLRVVPRSAVTDEDFSVVG